MSTSPRGASDSLVLLPVLEPDTPHVPTDLRKWLASVQCEHNYDDFVREDITPDLLVYLRRQDLKRFVPKVGDRVRLYAAINRLRPEWGTSPPVSPLPMGSTGFNNTNINNPAIIPNTAASLNVTSATSATMTAGGSLSASNGSYSHGNNQGDMPKSLQKTSPVRMLSAPTVPTLSSAEIAPMLPVSQTSTNTSPAPRSANLPAAPGPSTSSAKKISDSKPVTEVVFRMLEGDGDIKEYAVPFHGSGKDLRKRAMAAAGVTEATHAITDEFEFMNDAMIAQYASQGKEMFIDPVPDVSQSRDSGTVKVPYEDEKVPKNGSPQKDSDSTPNLDRSPRLRRPTSEHVSAHLDEFFPEARQDQLEETARNSRRFSRRLSLVRDTRRSWRFSNLLQPGGERSPLTAGDPAITSPGLTRRLSSLNPFPRPKPPIVDDDSRFLEEVDREMRAPSKWIRGKEIGKGSFGEVFMAVNQFNGELFAVKSVPLASQSMRMDGRWQRMVDTLSHEVDVLRSLEHENIVQYRGCKTADNFFNIFLEYVPGGSLQSMLQHMGAFSEDMVRHYVLQVVNGLEYLHSKQIIHRDIKGGNILVTDRGKIKISDFGLSKKVTDLHRLSMRGSPFWIAPEVIRQSGVTTQADIWSLGCLVIELITGKHPFPELQGAQALYQIGKLVAPEIPHTASPLLQDFLQQCLRINHEERPTAKELRSHPFFHAPESQRAAKTPE